MFAKLRSETHILWNCRKTMENWVSAPCLQSSSVVVTAHSGLLLGPEKCTPTIPTASRSPCLNRTVESLDHWLIQILINSQWTIQMHQDSQQCIQGTWKQYMEGQSCFGRPCQFSNTSDAAALQGSCFACSRVLDQFSQVATYNHRCACTPPLIWKLPVFGLPGMRSALLFGACR